MPANHTILCLPLFLLPSIFPSIVPFQMSQLFAWGGRSIGVSAATSVFPMNTQDWSPLGWNGWISLQSKGLSRIFSNTKVQSINSLALSFLYISTFRYIHDYWKNHRLYSVQFSSVQFSYSVVSDSLWPYGLKHTRPSSPSPTPGVYSNSYVHWVSDAIQLFHPLSSLSPPAFNLYHHKGLFQWANSLHQVAKVLEFQLQHQSFQWAFRIDFLYNGLVEYHCSPKDPPPKNKVCHCFPIYLPSSDGARCHDLSFLNVEL